MNEKKSLQDLVDLLAEKHELSKKEAEAVVKGIFDLIEEALDRDKYVKVKGLGTFKLTEVESRESVDVNTGERIEIQGHNKVSFTPDTAMKDQINKPFAHFETVILNEGIQLEDTLTETEEELAEEIRNENDADAVVDAPVLVAPAPGVSADVSQGMGEKSAAADEKSAVAVSSSASPVASSVSPDSSSVSSVTLSASSDSSSVSGKSPSPAVGTEGIEAAVGAESSVVGQSSSAAGKAPASGGESVASKTETEVASLTILARKVEITSERVTTHCMMMEDTDTPTKMSEKESCATSSEASAERVTPSAAVAAKTLATYRRWIGVLVVLLLLSLAVGVYLFVQNQAVQRPAVQAEGAGRTEPLSMLDPTPSSMQPQPVGTDTVAADTLVQPAARAAESPIAVTPSEQPATLGDTLEYEMSGTLANHTLKEGESLIKLSLKYYGNKELWPYIVQYNTEVIHDANRVPVGTQLRIPKLTLRP